MSDDLRAFPDRLNLFRRDRKMTMGDHLCYNPSDWHSYVRADLFEELEAEVARLRAELTKAADSLEWADVYLKDAGVFSANVHFGAREARAALNPGKDTP